MGEGSVMQAPRFSLRLERGVVNGIPPVVVAHFGNITSFVTISRGVEESGQELTICAWMRQVVREELG
jgi:hypothetical protein